VPCVVVALDDAGRLRAADRGLIQRQPSRNCRAQFCRRGIARHSSQQLPGTDQVPACSLALRASPLMLNQRRRLRGVELTIEVRLHE
jgi:hypothetical protein